MKPILRKPMSLPKQKQFYVIHKRASFFTSSVSTQEMEIYNDFLPPHFYYPSTLLMVFPNYIEAHQVQTFLQNKTRIQTKQVYLSKGTILLETIPQTMEEEPIPLTLQKGDFKETLTLAKYLKSNVFIVHKHFPEFHNLKIMGNFFPMLQFHPPGLEPGTYR